MSAVYHGVLIAGLILLGVGMYFIWNQTIMLATSLHDIQGQITQLKQAPAPTSAAPDVQNSGKIGFTDICNGTSTREFPNLGLCFSYPSAWIVQDFTTEMDQRDAIKITDKPGYLIYTESDGGPGVPGHQYFNDGYQITIQGPLTGDPHGLIKGMSKFEDYTDVYIDDDSCTLHGEAGCQPYHLFYSPYQGSDTSVWEIMFDYTATDAIAKPYLETFLKSLSTQ